jgi:hypothetical protein
LFPERSLLDKETWERIMDDYISITIIGDLIIRQLKLMLSFGVNDPSDVSFRL